MTNRFATLALNYWTTNLPTRYVQLEDPKQYFDDLGEQIQAQVDQMAMTIAGSDPEGEQYLEKVARLTTATKTAEETVLADLLYAETPESQEDREEWEANQPDAFALMDARLKVEELRDQGGWTEQELQEILDRATPKPYPGPSAER